MELSVARPDRSVKVRPHRVLVNLTGLLLELISKQVHQVLHQVSLTHEQVLPNVSAVAFKLVLVEKNLQELGIGHLVSLLDPLLKLVDIEVVLVSLEGGLQRHVKNPVLLLTAASDKVDRFASLKDLVGQAV